MSDERIPIYRPNFREQVLQGDATARDALVAWAGSVVQEVHLAQLRGRTDYVNIRQIFASIPLNAALAPAPRLLGILVLADEGLTGTFTLPEILNAKAYADLANLTVRGGPVSSVVGGTDVGAANGAASAAAFGRALARFDTPNAFADWVVAAGAAVGSRDPNMLALPALRAIYALLAVNERSGCSFERFLDMLATASPGLGGLSGAAVSCSAVRTLAVALFEAARAFADEIGLCAGIGPEFYPVFQVSDAQQLLDLCAGSEAGSDSIPEGSDFGYDSDTLYSSYSMSSDDVSELGVGVHSGIGRRPSLVAPPTACPPTAASPVLAPAISSYEYYEYDEYYEYYST